jgi:hypothetical protein
MTPNDVYDKYITKSEKNSTNDNFSTDKGKVALLYNELSVRLIQFYLRNRQLDSKIDIQVLLVDSLKLGLEESKESYSLFNLPQDFLSWSSASATGSKGNCSNQYIDLFELRDEDKSNILTSSFFSPSFDYREAPYNYVGNKLKVYKETDMAIDEAFLTYYKNPKQITLQDPDNPESAFQNVQIELPEQVVDRIVSAMVGDFKINNADQSFQFDKLRQNENIS